MLEHYCEKNFGDFFTQKCLVLIVSLNLITCFPEIYLHHKVDDIPVLVIKLNLVHQDRHQSLISMKDQLMA